MSQLLEEIINVSQKGTNRSTLKITNYKQAIGLALVSGFKSKKGHAKNSKEEFYTELFQESFDECCFYLDQLQHYVADDKEPEKLVKIKNRLEYHSRLVGELIQENSALIVERLHCCDERAIATACHILSAITSNDLEGEVKSVLDEVLTSRRITAHQELPILKRKPGNQ